MSRPTCNILVLPGGGIRGLIQAIILAVLHAGTGFLRHVDVIVGTSVGAIIAFYLAAGRDPERAIDLFKKDGPAIFRPPWWRRPSFLWGLVAARFSPARLRAALEREIGDVHLGELRCHVAVTSRDRANRKSKIWTNKKGDPDCDQLARTIAYASAAAPSYFPPALVGRPDGSVEEHIDGGVFANDPTAVGLARAIDLGHQLGDCRVLVVGTGDPPQKRDPWWTRFLGWGLLRWLGCGLITEFLDGPQDWVRYGSRSALADSGGKYHYVSPKLERAIDLADVSAIPALESIAMKHDVGATIRWLRIHWNR